MKHIGYKVVSSTKHPKVFWSFVYHGQYNLQYEIGKITIPKIGKIFIFNTLEQAIKYSGGLDPILEVEYEYDLKFQMTRIGCALPHRYETFWKFLTSDQTSDLPVGTLLVDMVKPIRVISCEFIAKMLVDEIIL